jgi:hypothetical protein
MLILVRDSMKLGQKYLLQSLVIVPEVARFIVEKAAALSPYL